MFIEGDLGEKRWDWETSSDIQAKKFVREEIREGESCRGWGKIMDVRPVSAKKKKISQGRERERFVMTKKERERKKKSSVEEACVRFPFVRFV